MEDAMNSNLLQMNIAASSRREIFHVAIFHQEQYSTNSPHLQHLAGSDFSVFQTENHPKIKQTPGRDQDDESNEVIKRKHRY
jgi:hypothetical protein